MGYLQAVGIRVKLRPLERAAFFKAYQEKKLKNLAYSISGAFGNAASRLEVFTVGGGPYVYGSYPDIDGLFREQAAELDRKRREATAAPDPAAHPREGHVCASRELGFIHAHGPRVAESGLGLITGWAFSAPYEDLKLKRQISRHLDQGVLHEATCSRPLRLLVVLAITAAVITSAAAPDTPRRADAPARAEARR